MTVLVALSFTSTDCTIQDGEQRVSPRRDYLKGDRMVRRGFKGQYVTARVWQSMEMGWSHIGGERSVCLPSLICVTFSAGVFFQPSTRSFFLLEVRIGLEAALLPFPNHALSPG